MSALNVNVFMICVPAIIPMRVKKCTAFENTLHQIENIIKLMMVLVFEYSSGLLYIYSNIIYESDRKKR